MSVFERPKKGSGHWHCSFKVNGLWIRKAIKEARTKRHAEKAERILRDEIFENRYGDGGQKLLSDFVENSYKPYAEENKKGYTVELSALKVLIEKFGKKKLIDISPEEIENFKRQRVAEITTRGNFRSRATVNR